MQLKEPWLEGVQVNQAVLCVHNRFSNIPTRMQMMVILKSLCALFN